jgi:hypothetical protein
MGVKRTEDRICVGAVLVRERDDRRNASPLVLLGRRDAGRAFYPGVWDLLGGHQNVRSKRRRSVDEGRSRDC